MMELPMPVVCECGFNTMDAKRAYEHTLKHEKEIGMMEYTKEELTRWLRAELVDLVKDIGNVRKSNMPEFNQGLDIICAYDTKVEKILKRLVVTDLYEACKYALWATRAYLEKDAEHWQEFADTLTKAIAKAENK